MSDVRYIGLFDAVEVPLPDGSRARVERGKTLTTTAEHANQLVDTTSDSWEHVKRSPEPKKSAGKAAPRASAPAEPSSKEE